MTHWLTITPAERDILVLTTRGSVWLAADAWRRDDKQ